MRKYTETESRFIQIAIDRLKQFETQSRQCGKLVKQFMLDELCEIHELPFTATEQIGDLELLSSKTETLRRHIEGILHRNQTM